MDRRTFLASTGAAALAIPALNVSSEARPQSSVSPPDPSKSYEPWLDIKLDGLTWNVKQLSARADNKPVMAVLKDNAYGHGIVGVAEHLDTIPEVSSFAVVKIQEAIDIKNSAAKKPVALLGPTTDEELEYIVAHDIMPAIYNDRGRLLEALAEKYQKEIRIHLYVDTGMGRVGVPYYQAMPLIESLAGRKGITFDGVLSELTEVDEFDIQQVRRLNGVYEEAASKGIALGNRHAASSGGIFHVPEAYLDMVRPGISIYGCYPTDRSTKTRDIPLKPTFEFKTRVMYVKQLRAGDSLQYGRHYVADKPIWIATLPVGHSDGWPRTTANNCEVLIKGRRYPLVASLSANHCLAEIGDVPSVDIGDEVVLIGESGGEMIDAHTVAEQSGVGVYTLTMHLNPWLPRRYSG